MQLFCETILEDYLCEQANVDYSHPLIQDTLRHLHNSKDSEVERIKKAYAFVRDSVHHSLDIGSTRVTCVASDVLTYREGLCYAKSHLLAALLRAQNIPTGFCYQRLLFGSTPDEGYVLHGLNAVYLSSESRWIRLDARGNKSGIQAEFSIQQERLAFVVQPALGEVDYSTIYAQPHHVVVTALQAHSNCLDLCEHFLPDRLAV